MDFLEDMGGFFGIVYLFGQILNELLSCGNPSIDYLKHYYRVSGDVDVSSNTGQDKLKKNKKNKV